MDLTYAGLTAACDVVIDFDNAQTGFAVCFTSGTFISGDDAAITSANVYFNTGFSWHFNDTLTSIFADGFESGNTSAW